MFARAEEDDQPAGMRIEAGYYYGGVAVCLAAYLPFHPVVRILGCAHRCRFAVSVLNARLSNIRVNSRTFAVSLYGRIRG
jgi:hypothetical protein